ncbi:hypothetical protein [Hyphococcus sp.]|uniref:hypothetical protein n=1 Tax=Hyphococcus sp. TaxID=2038636 RepID=UPI003CCC3354
MRMVAGVLVWALFIAWAACVALGFNAYMTLEADGSGFTRGWNRVSAFLQWQGYALIAAIAGSIAGRVASATGVMRFASRIPLWLSGGFFIVLTVLFVGAIVYTRVVGQ